MKTKTKEVPAKVSEANIVQIRKDATKLSTHVQELTVESAEDVAQAAEVLANIAKATKHIEAQQKQVTSRLDELKKIEKARWKPALDLLNAADQKLRGQVIQYRRIEQANAKKEEERILKQLTTGRIKKETTAMAKLDAVQSSVMGKTVASDSGSVGFRTLQKLSIVDENKIPREYLVPDEQKIKAALKVGKSVPGCVIIEEETLAVK
jgi:hypothetical protein